jgi:hypothetical protein
VCCGGGPEEGCGGTGSHSLRALALVVTSRLPYWGRGAPCKGNLINPHRCTLLKKALSSAVLVLGWAATAETQPLKRTEISAVLTAIEHVESRGNDHVVSSRGARGRYQLLPKIARWCGIDPLMRAQARRCAGKLLRLNLQRFGDLRTALAAYVAGAGAVRRWLRKQLPWPKRVVAYADAVLARVEVIR